MLGKEGVGQGTQRVKDEKGLTLLEMLIAILVFILATVFIVSLVSNALDKPKEAGIRGALDHYGQSAQLLLSSGYNVEKDEDGDWKGSYVSALDDEVDKSAKFGTGNSSNLKNAYKNNYKVVVDGDGEDVVYEFTTTGNKKTYRLVVARVDGEVSTCTSGFGRNDIKPTASTVGYCTGIDGEVVPEIAYTPDEDFTWVSSLDTGAYTNKGGSRGYYKYNGTGESVVRIPPSIDGTSLTSYFRMFYGTGADVTTVMSENSNVTSMSYMFHNSKATTLDLSSFDTSKVTGMQWMFNDSKATTLDLSNFDTSNVTDMGWMFQSSKATTLDLSSFDTSKVTGMQWMFQSSEATTLDLSNFDTSNVTDMGWMFQSSKATTLDLSSFDTSNVTDMARMFVNTPATTLDLSNFDTSNVTSMSYMFHNSKATTLDLSNFDTSNVTNMGDMFYGSRASTLDLSSFDTSNVTNMGWMFLSSQATTGYAKTTMDAAKFNGSSTKPSGLVFVVK